MRLLESHKIAEVNFLVDFPVSSFIKGKRRKVMIEINKTQELIKYF
jgi:hypothetical protein